MNRFILAGLLVPILACGGSTHNAALKDRVKDSHLAPVAADSRTEEAQANQLVFLAEWQIRFTKSQIEGAELDIKIAKNDLAAAKIEVKSAKIEAKAADQIADMNKVKESEQAEKVAGQTKEMTAVAKERAKQNLKYLKKRLVYEETVLRSLEARQELARAQSMHASGIKPPKFDMATYKSQYSERKAKAKSYKGDVDEAYNSLKALDVKLGKSKEALSGGQELDLGPDDLLVTPMPKEVEGPYDVSPAPTTPRAPAPVAVPSIPVEDVPAQPGPAAPTIPTPEAPTQETPAPETPAPETPTPETPTPSPAPSTGGQQ